MSIIVKDSINFLQDLREHNTREWFGEHKGRYEVAKENIKAFQESLVSEMNKVDDIEKSKLFRIYRDVRFSKDKTPYNSHWSISMTRRKPQLRGGYYLRLTPDGATVACGFWNPEPSDLKLIRANIDRHPDLFRQAISHPDTKKVFGKMQGDGVKSAPKGYSKEHPAIDLLRHKQFLFYKEMSVSSISSKDFCKKVVTAYQAIRPFYNYMSDILSQDLNGRALY